MLIRDETKKQADWGLLLLVLLIGLIGAVTLYSAAASDTDSQQWNLFFRQLTWLSGGLVLILVSLLFNHKTLYVWAEGLYLFCIGLLLAVVFFGTEAGGARRWLPVGPIAIQPSEFVKLAVVVILAKYYARHTGEGRLSLRQLIIPFIIIAVPFALIKSQPDLGTALIMVLVAVSMTAFVGIARRTLYFLTGLTVIFLPLTWLFFLHDYQKERILTFLNPNRDPLGAGYHIIQSKIAIGSGMITGKGFLKGTQNALAFLPEQHTDFIMSVLAEEWGLIGTSFVLLLYLLIIIWAISIAYHCRDMFRMILAVGVAAMIFWPVFINAGMVMGLLPVVGVPMPLISYGGSSTVAFLLGIALLLNVSRKRTSIE